MQELINISNLMIINLEMMRKHEHFELDNN